MNNPDHDLDELFDRLRAEPPSPAVDHVARALPARVAARLASGKSELGAVWFWRWSAAFSVATGAILVCAVIAAIDLSRDALTQPDAAAWLLNFWL